MKKFSVLLALLLLATGAVSAKPKHPAPRLFHYQGEVSLRGAVSAPTPELGISYINGVRFNPYLFVGGGIGLHSNDYGIYVPLSLDIKGYIPVGRHTDFMFFCDGGLMFDPEHPSHGFIRPGFGLNFHVVKSFAINIGFYYEYAPYELNNNDIEAASRYYTQRLHSIGFALGFSF